MKKTCARELCRRASSRALLRLMLCSGPIEMVAVKLVHAVVVGSYVGLLIIAVPQRLARSRNVAFVNGVLSLRYLFVAQLPRCCRTVSMVWGSSIISGSAQSHSQILIHVDGS